MFNNILIIDDDGSNLKLLSSFLYKRGFKITTASTAEEGYDLITDEPPDVLLLDLKLPGMDGLELTHILRQNSATKDIIIIAVTAYENTFDEEKAREAGCDEYIIKPINILNLSDTLNTYFKSQ